MKKIKMLLPLWLVLLFAGSAVFMFKTRLENSGAYNQMVEEARAYAQAGIVVDAIEFYEEALDLNPNVDLCVEAGEVYLTNEEYYNAKRWYKSKLHTNYPENVKTYDFGIRMYLAQDNYRGAFEIYDEYQDRGLSSKSVETLIKGILYTYDLSGQYEDVRPFSNLTGIAAVRHKDHWGYIDKEGSRVLDYIYLSAGVFGEMASVTDENGQAYFVDSEGNKKITEKSVLEKDPDFGCVTEMKGIEDNLFWAYNGEYWNCYSAETCEKQFGGYANVTEISNGIGAISKENEKWALVDSSGQELTDYEYDEVLLDEKGIFCRTDAVIVKKDGKCILLDKNGKQIGKTNYEEAYAFYDNTWAAVKKDGKWLFVNEDGKETDLGNFEDARSFSGGLAAVKQEGKWGYIDTEGDLVIDYQFEEAGPFSSAGTTFVKPEGEKWRLLSLYKENHD